jgi:3-hydroxyisobutyrate dehydrogenase-like beta-hydroxyacid dehydrogenase
MKIGWIGAGRMGSAMARRLARAGCDITVWNRTPAKAAALAADGAKVAQSLSDLGACEVVFCMVSTWNDVKEVIAGASGLLSKPDLAVQAVVECSSISFEGSAELRQILTSRGIQLLAAPVSGNAKVVNAGKLSFAASGPRDLYERVQPLLAHMGRGSSWVGEGELARIVKICHNVFLGTIAQSLAEITLLAEKAGVPRHAWLAFLNDSVLGSTFTRYKTPALVNLDYSVTFTTKLLLKDLDLGLDAGRARQVPLPLASTARDLVQRLSGHGYGEQDFAALIALQAQAAGMAIESENVAVSDGLS